MNHSPNGRLVFVMILDLIKRAIKRLIRKPKPKTTIKFIFVKVFDPKTHINFREENLKPYGK